MLWVLEMMQVCFRQIPAHGPFQQCYFGLVWYGLWCLMPLSTISWQAVLLVEETRVPRENHRPVTSH